LLGWYLLGFLPDQKASVDNNSYHLILKYGWFLINFSCCAFLYLNKFVKVAVFNIIFSFFITNLRSLFYLFLANILVFILSLFEIFVTGEHGVIGSVFDRHISSFLIIFTCYIQSLLFF